MFEHFTERARRVIFFARHEAGQHGSPSIAPHHILLGILRVEDQLASVTTKHGNELAAIRAEIESQIEIGPRISNRVEIPFSAESKYVLNHAVREAEELGHREVGAGHLFLGLLDEPESLAAQILANHRLDAASVRKALADSPSS